MPNRQCTLPMDITNKQSNRLMFITKRLEQLSRIKEGQEKQTLLNVLKWINEFGSDKHTASEIIEGAIATDLEYTDNNNNLFAFVIYMKNIKEMKQLTCVN